MTAHAPSLLFCLLLALHTRALSQAPAGPPVRVWLGSGPALASGDRAQVFVHMSSDGNLVVLHARTDGRVEVLFPGDPASDPFVRAGTYEIRAPSGGDAFAASGSEGRGMVVAALSPDPMWFDEFVQNNTWDAAALTGESVGEDPEALLTDVVQRMLGDGSFTYDVVTYTVAPRPVAIADAAGQTLQPAAACIECSFPQVVFVSFLHRRRSGAAAPAAPPAPAAIAVYSAHRPTGAARSLLLMRVKQGARGPDLASSGVATVSAPVVAAPARVTATAGHPAVPTRAAGFVGAPAPRVTAAQAGPAAPASARAVSAAGEGFASPLYRRAAARATR